MRKSYNNVVFADTETTTISKKKFEKIQNQNKKCGFDSEVLRLFPPKSDVAFVYLIGGKYCLSNSQSAEHREFRYINDWCSNLVDFACRPYHFGHGKQKTNNTIIFFHNLNYDFTFIRYHLLEYLTSVHLDYHTECVALSATNLISVTITSDETYQAGKDKETKEPILRPVWSIEIHCTYKLYGISIAAMGDICGYPKLDGKEIYGTEIYCDTQLTEQQEHYFYRDTDIMYHYMLQQSNNNLFSYVNTLPLTITGAVRKTINRMFPQKYGPSTADLYKCYQQHVKRCKQLNSVIENDEIFSFFVAKSFSGGQVGINLERKGQIQSDVYSMDLRSSYPTVLCACKYPDGKPHETTSKLVFQKLLEWSKMPMLDCLADAVSSDIGFLASITFKNLRIKPEFVNFPYAKYMVARIEKDLYLMKNDAAKLSAYTVGNIEAYQHSISSKIYRADVVSLCTLHTDLAAISKLYTYDDIQINRVYVYKMTYSEYLQKVIERFAQQKSFSKQLLKDWDIMKQSPETYKNEFMAFTDYPYYEHAKTLSKAEFDTQYYIMVDKAQFNANYGINAESPFKQNYIPTEFEIAEQDIIIATRKTTSLMIGSYCTSYARLELLCGFFALQDMGGTFLYSDTDSLKFTDAEFKAVNDTANLYLRYVFTENELTKKYGFLRFDFDGHYDMFITNAPKFYMYTADGNETIHTKLSGFSELGTLAAELQNEYSTKDVLRILSLNNLRLSTELVMHLDHITHMSNNLYVLLQYIPKMLSQNTHSITLEKLRYNFENIYNADNLKNYDYSKIHDMTYRKTPVLL